MASMATINKSLHPAHQPGVSQKKREEKSREGTGERRKEDYRKESRTVPSKDREKSS